MDAEGSLLWSAALTLSMRQTGCLLKYFQKSWYFICVQLSRMLYHTILDVPGTVGPDVNE
jgi:hypothetical protein